MRFFTLALLAILLTSCMRHEIIAGGGGNTTRNPDQQVWADHYIWGAGGDPRIYLDQVCKGSKDSTVKIDYSLPNLLVDWITFGLYNPSRIQVWCGEIKQE